MTAYQRQRDYHDNRRRHHPDHRSPSAPDCWTTTWLGDPSLALGSIIAITVWKNSGYYMLFFLAGLAGVPQELLDAGKIDGANSVQPFLWITLPLLARHSASFW